MTTTLPRTARKRLYRRLRKQVDLQRDPCPYCLHVGCETIDHIRPTFLGGTDQASNLTGACPTCNGLKGSTPMLMFLIQHGGYPIQREKGGTR